MFFEIKYYRLLGIRVGWIEGNVEGSIVGFIEGMDDGIHVGDVEGLKVG